MAAAANPEMLKEVLGQQLLNAAQFAEEQVDSELKKLENMGEDDLEVIRRRRIEQMKKAQQQKQNWLAAGHGEYSELPEEKEFFETWKKSDRVVCQFYRDSEIKCKILDKHLRILAAKHVETRFVSLNADKCPFLMKKLNMRVIPTIAIIKEGQTCDYVRGFDDLGGTDEFPTEILEWRLAQSGVINYSGDLSKPPGVKKGGEGPKPILGFKGKSKNKNLRDTQDSSDDEDDW